jgi:hypothetical protein
MSLMGSAKELGPSGADKVQKVYAEARAQWQDDAKLVSSVLTNAERVLAAGVRMPETCKEGEDPMAVLDRFGAIGKELAEMVDRMEWRGVALDRVDGSVVAQLGAVDVESFTSKALHAQASSVPVHDRQAQFESSAALTRREVRDRIARRNRIAAAAAAAAAAASAAAAAGPEEEEEEEDGGGKGEGKAGGGADEDEASGARRGIVKREVKQEPEEAGGRRSLRPSSGRVSTGASTPSTVARRRVSGGSVGGGRRDRTPGSAEKSFVADEGVEMVWSVAPLVEAMPIDFVAQAEWDEPRQIPVCKHIFNLSTLNQFPNRTRTSHCPTCKKAFKLDELIVPTEFIRQLGVYRKYLEDTRVEPELVDVDADADADADADD